MNDDPEKMTAAELLDASQLRRKAFAVRCSLCHTVRKALRCRVKGSTGYRVWRWCEKCDKG